MSKLYLLLFCVVLAEFLVAGAPSFSGRTSRDTDQIDGVRARLYRLQQQIHDLEAAEEGSKREEAATGTGTGREHDVSQESQMVSKQRQKQVQTLAKELDANTNSDLHELAETLNQLLRQSGPANTGSVRTNSAGEFLNDRYNAYKRQEGMHSIREQQKKEEVEEDEEDEEEEEEEEDETKRLQNIYNMLLKLYTRQKNGGEEEEEEEEKEVEPRKLSQSAQSSVGVSSSRYGAPDFEAGEGTFGHFVDAGEESWPAGSLHDRAERRKSVLSAVEKKLLDDLEEAREVGISVDDLIHDVENKAQRERTEKLREIETELDKLSESVRQ